jgi:EmrB/QacA subfamily drug resistance transporter
MSAISPPSLKSVTAVTDDVDPEVWKVAAVVFLGPLMTQMDSTVVNVSLSTIRQQLNCSIDSAQWIISGYLLALALIVPLNAWLVDRLGAKRLYLWCFSAFTLASLLCGAARTIDQLVWARVIQGVAGGLLIPMAQMMLAQVAGKHMARVMGYMAMPILLAPILGPIVAGAILKYASWPWLFYINLPIGILAVILATYLLPADKVAIRKRPFDWLGFLLISPGLAFLLYGLDHTSQVTGICALLSGVTLISTFVVHAIRKAEDALIDVRLFRNRIFSTATITQFLSIGANFAGQLLIPLYLVTGCEFSPTKAGWMLVPMGLGMMCVYPRMGSLTEKFGCRAVSVSGTLLVILGTLPFFWMIQNHFSLVLMVIAMFARGAGQGAIGVPAVAAGYVSIPKEKLTIATTAANIAQRLGGPIATTIMAIVISGSAAHCSAHGPQIFFMGFTVLIGFQLLVLSAANLLPLRIHQSSSDQCS